MLMRSVTAVSCRRHWSPCRRRLKTDRRGQNSRAADTVDRSVSQRCDLWIEGYKVNRQSTVREARTHIRRIVDEFGHVLLSAVRPSHVKAWVGC